MEDGSEGILEEKRERKKGRKRNEMKEKKKGGKSERREMEGRADTVHSSAIKRQLSNLTLTDSGTSSQRVQTERRTGRRGDGQADGQTGTRTERLENDCIRQTVMW